MQSQPGRIWPVLPSPFDAHCYSVWTSHLVGVAGQVILPSQFGSPLPSWRCQREGLLLFLQLFCMKAGHEVCNYSSYPRVTAAEHRTRSVTSAQIFCGWGWRVRRRCKCGPGQHVKLCAIRRENGVMEKRVRRGGGRAEAREQG